MRVRGKNIFAVVGNFPFLHIRHNMNGAILKRTKYLSTFVSTDSQEH